MLRFDFIHILNFEKPAATERNDAHFFELMLENALRHAYFDLFSAVNIHEGIAHGHIQEAVFADADSV